jgi:hypothetical protein
LGLQKDAPLQGCGLGLFNRTSSALMDQMHWDCLLPSLLLALIEDLPALCNSIAIAGINDAFINLVDVQPLSAAAVFYDFEGSIHERRAVPGSSIIRDQ